MNKTENNGKTGTGVSVGRVLGGRYRLEALIAGGGMGEVYRASRLHIGDQVAVKVLRAELVDNAVTRERFQREARAAARLRHPHAVVIHDFGEEADGVAFIVMELLDGRSLRQVLDEEGPLAPGRVNSLLAQICAVLAEGHKQGIIHRDLKPENVIVNQPPGMTEQVKLLDFGIAKLLDKEDTGNLEPALTKVGTFIGTPSYMSPEQCQGEPVNERSDIYSLGVVLYELLTGQLPFTAKTPTGVAIKHVTEAAPSLRTARPDLSEALDAVVLRALAKETEARQVSAQALAQEFAAACDSTLSAGRGATQPTPAVAQRDDHEIATNLLPQARVTNPQKRQTEIRPAAKADNADNAAGAPPNNYETTIGSAVPNVGNAAASEVATSTTTSEPLPPSAGLDTQRLGRGNASGAADWLTKLKAQPQLLAAAAAVLLLVVVAGWWLTASRSETPVATPVATVAPTLANSPTATPTATPAATFEDMVFVPGGALLLNAATDGKCPTVPVTLKPFYLDKTEVTNEQYQLFLSANNSTPPPSWKGGVFAAGTERQPVTDVSWEDAVNYAAWKGKRLPTEAEWEFAARGGNDWLYPWGAEFKAEAANLESKQLQPVGSLPAGASPFGVLDLLGNAAEWTASDFSACAKADSASTSSDASKVVRGGSYETAAKLATTAYRQSLPAKRAANANLKAIGFRCAQDVP